MPRKGENIFKRKDGRWEARYVKGYDKSGRLQYGYIYGRTYRQVKEKRRDHLHQLTDRINREGQSQRMGSDAMVFADLADRWLNAKQSEVKPSTYSMYAGIVEKHLLPFFGALALQDIDGALLASFIDEEMGGLSPKRIKDILAVFKMIAAAGTEEGLHIRATVVPPKVYPVDIRVLSVGEQRRLKEAMLQDIDPRKLGVLLSLYTGMRIGELCALRWEQISLEDQTVEVKQTMQRIRVPMNGKKTRVIIDEPKSKASKRTVPLADFLVPYFEAMRPEDQQAFFLTGRADKFLEPRSYQYVFGVYLKKLSIASVSFHTLRHTFATRCIEVGFDVKSLSEILGHATVSMTMNRYVHPSMASKRAGLNLLANSV